MPLFRLPFFECLATGGDILICVMCICRCLCVKEIDLTSIGSKSKRASESKIGYKMDAKLIDSGITYLLIFNFVSYYRYIIRLRKLNCLFQHKIFHIFR